jgi:hypothetical protein
MVASVEKWWLHKLSTENSFYLTSYKPPIYRTMEDLIFLLTASLFYYKSSKQVKQVRIGKTPCTVLFSTSAAFETTRTEAGDRLYFSEYQQERTTYGVICGHLSEPLNYEESYNLLSAYMDDLRQPLYAVHNTGITDVASRKTNFIELTDFWQDKSGIDWEVKGYTNGKQVAVLYVKNISDASTEKQDAFLNSFSFGE